MKKSQADEDYIFLMCLSPSMKKKDIRRLELRISQQRNQENSIL